MLVKENAISVEKAGKKEFPHLFVLLFAIIVMAMIATYIVPAGEYERVFDEETNRHIIDPTSFKYVEKSPVGIFAMLLSIIEGFNQASSITFMIFMAFSSLYIVEQTGAIDAGIVWMVNKAKDNPNSTKAMIVITMTLLSIWASTGTLSFEEIVAFVPIFTTLSIALGYDPLVGLGMSYIPVGIGFASATVNPFTIGVAQGIAELPLFSGLGLRVAVLAVMTLITIIYVFSYAEKIKKDPSKSIVADIDFNEFTMDEKRMQTKFTIERKLTLLILFIGVSIMGYGLIKLGWYINEVAAIFLGVAIAVGVINGWNPNKIAHTLVEGLSRGVLSALVVGVARGILVVIDKGKILDTIIFSAATILNKMSLYLSSIGMLFFQTLLNFLIPSGSGQAATTMPIMIPLADLIGMNRQLAVLIFQFGDGFSNLIWPTSFVLIACSIAKVPLNRYYKWFMPLFGMSFIVQIMSIIIAMKVGYGPF